MRCFSTVVPTTAWACSTGACRSVGFEVRCFAAGRSGVRHMALIAWSDAVAETPRNGVRGRTGSGRSSVPATSRLDRPDLSVTSTPRSTCEGGLRPPGRPPAVVDSVPSSLRRRSPLRWGSVCTGGRRGVGVGTGGEARWHGVSADRPANSVDHEPALGGGPTVDQAYRAILDLEPEQRGLTVDEGNGVGRRCRAEPLDARLLEGRDHRFALQERSSREHTREPPSEPQVASPTTTWVALAVQ